MTYANYFLWANYELYEVVEDITSLIQFISQNLLRDGAWVVYSDQIKEKQTQKQYKTNFI